MIPSPGRILYLLRKNYREGWSTPYYRDRIRPQILQSPAIHTGRSGEVEVFVLTRGEDLVNLLWSLKSFYHFSARDYPLTILEDGTLDAAGEKIVRQHFPTARLIRSADADAAMANVLARYPRCKQYRARHALARKAFDVGHYCTSPRVLLLDTDLVFFDEPTDLLARAEAPTFSANAFNADVSPGLNISQTEARERFQIELPDRINSGLGIMRREVFNLDWMEEFLCCDSLMAGHIWRVEQTLLALAAARDGVELLPPNYLVSLRPGLDGCVVRHYVGAVRHLMYREGIAKLTREGFLAALRAKAGSFQPQQAPV